ncbi:MAG TPA: sigma-70 family RNA polymerase sigma factor [Acidimicrobiales bacterium]|nr:sigma-70 family RNA polymerase sigma factor [Acidimicrobiales bacterium]
MGRRPSDRPRWLCRGAPRRLREASHLTESLEAIFRSHWWSAVATVTRTVGNLEVAEDAVQEACAIALSRWAAEGVPANPSAWLVGVAHHKAVDWLRREAKRSEKEAAAVPDSGERDPPRPAPSMADDELALIFMCRHPAFDRGVRVALTLRSVCGLSTTEIGAAFLVPEPTMAKRLARAKHKIRQAGIPFRVPPPEDLPKRLDDVLRVIYLVFTEGHMATTGPQLIRGHLCVTAIDLARRLRVLLPEEPEVTGLLALLLLTDARRAARTNAAGDLVLLEEQDRSQWDKATVAEGEALIVQVLRVGRPGSYQLWAAIAACHSAAPSAEATDWRQIAALYGELIRYEPTPVAEANRAIAVAMAEGPAAGLVILDAVGAHPQLSRWPQLHVARADLLRRPGRTEEAVDAYRTALELEPPAAERIFVHSRIRQLTGTTS